MEAPAPLLNELASSRDLVLQARHALGEEVEVAGVIFRVGMRGVFITNGAQRLVGPRPEVSEHGGVLVLQCLSVDRLLPALLREGLRSGNSLLKQEQLSTGGGQLGLHGDQGSRCGLLALLPLSQP